MKASTLPLGVATILCLVHQAASLRCHECQYSKSKASGDNEDFLNLLLSSGAGNEDCHSGDLKDEQAVECRLPYNYTGLGEIEVYCGKVTEEGTIDFDATDTKIKIEGTSRGCAFYDPDPNELSALFYPRTSRPELSCRTQETSEFGAGIGDDIFKASAYKENHKVKECYCDTDFCNASGHVTLSVSVLLLAALLAAIVRE